MGVVLSFKKRKRIGSWLETVGYLGRVMNTGEVMCIHLKFFITKEGDINIISSKIFIEYPIKSGFLTMRMGLALKEC